MTLSSIHYQTVDAANVMLAKVVGHISFSQMNAFMSMLASSERYVPGMNSLYDLSECESLSGDLSILGEFSDRLKDDRSIGKPSNTVIIVPDYNVQLAKLVEGIVLMTSGSIITHKMFRHSDKFSAYEYLTVDPQYIQECERFLLSH